jgi:alkylhydroperoxidase family enzyme
LPAAPPVVYRAAPKENAVMPQPDHISALGIGEPASLDADLRAIYDKCVEKLGFVPNVYHAYSLRPAKLRNFIAMYNELMLAPSGLSKLEREMRLSGDPELGEMIAFNYRVAKLDPRQRAMLDFAWKLTTTPYLVDEADRAALRVVGLSEQDIFDLAETAAFFNLSNRMASATDMMPNPEYHRLDR